MYKKGDRVETTGKVAYGSFRFLAGATGTIVGRNSGIPIVLFDTTTMAFPVLSTYLVPSETKLPARKPRYTFRPRKKEPTERMKRLIDFIKLFESLPYGRTSGMNGGPSRKCMKPALLEMIALIRDYTGGAKVKYKGVTAERLYLKYEIARNAPVDFGFLVAADFIRDQGYDVEVIEQRGTDNVANVDYVKIVIS